MSIAISHEKTLDVLRSVWNRLDLFEPGGLFCAGGTNGKFRLGTKELVSDAKGESRISFADYAIALVDEIEKPAHRKASFSVGY